MKVMIGAPVRNRAWILPKHLSSIKRDLEIDCETMYIVNNCEDSTELVLRTYDANYVKCDLVNRTEREVRGAYSISNIATLRNILIDKFLESDCDYLFSCDSDIIIPPNSIKRLIDHDKDIVSMLIQNHPTMLAYNIMNRAEGKMDEYYHPYEIPEMGLLKVDLTCAVSLIKRKVLESGVRYADHANGEDAPFCTMAHMNGFEIYCDTTLKPIHAYSKDQYLIAETR